MPGYLEVPPSPILSEPFQHFPNGSMQVLPSGSRQSVVRLGSNQLIAELESPMHFTEKSLLPQSGQGLTCRRRREFHDVIQAQVGKPATEHSGEVERRSRGSV